MKEKIKFIKELSKSVNESKINGIKYEEKDFEVQIIKKVKERRTVVYGNQPLQVQNTIQQEVEATSENIENTQNIEVAQEEISGTKIESPMVGTFYASPSPTSDPFIKEGDTVTEGQTLCIVEAMKLMNEIKSSVAGKVKKILVKDGQAIKKGQALVIIE